MIKLNKLNKEEFEVKKRRLKTIDTGFKIVEITALFENRGSYTKTFAYDEEKGTLYAIDYKEEEVKTKWGIKPKLYYVTKYDEVIKNMENLKNSFLNSHSGIIFKFQKK